MGVASRFLSSRSHPASGDPVLVEMFGGRGTASGQRVTAESTLNIAAAYRAIRLISDTIAGLPLHLYRRLERGKERASANPLYFLMHSRPNPWQTSFEWREMMQGHLELRGNAYSFINLDGRGGIESLIPLHPGRTVCHKGKVFHDRPPMVWYEWQPLDGPAKVLLQDEVLHIRGFSADGITGLSTVELARESLGLALAAEKHGAMTFGNGVRPGGFLKITKKLPSKEARDKLIETLNQRFGGNNQNKVGVLEEGSDWVSVGFTNKDAEFLASRKFQVTEIARWFGIPPHKIADLERSTNNNIEHQGIEYVQDAILPRCRRWEQRLSMDLLAARDQRSLFFEFNLDAVARADQKSRYEAYAIGRNSGFLSANDIRELENMNPLEGEQGEIYLVPLNMVPADQAGEPPVPEPQQPEPDAEDDAARMAIAFQSLFRDTAQRCVTAEVKAARRALEKSREADSLAQFDAWLAKWIDEHRSMIQRNFEPVVATYARAIGHSAAVTELVAGIAQRELQASVDAWKAVKRTGTTAEIVDACLEVLDLWESERAETIAAQEPRRIAAHLRAA